MTGERREYVILDRTPRAHGRSTVDIECPFCSTIFTAYIWSIHGGGKRCENSECRALHSSSDAHLDK